jgi:hypothetical protein
MVVAMLCAHRAKSGTRVVLRLMPTVILGPEIFTIRDRNHARVGLSQSLALISAVPKREDRKCEFWPPRAVLWRTGQKKTAPMVCGRSLRAEPEFTYPGEASTNWLILEEKATQTACHRVQLFWFCCRAAWFIGPEARNLAARDTESECERDRLPICPS